MNSIWNPKILRALYLLALIVFWGLESHANILFEGDGASVLTKRFGLVIGVGRYKDTGTQFSNLPNAESDAELIAKKLKDIGFTEVQTVISSDKSPWVTHQEILRAVYDFRKVIEDEIRTGEFAEPAILIYYAGHGFSWKGNHYLVPADFYVKFAEDIPRFGIPLVHLVKAITGAKPITVFVIVDACRDLPFDALPSIVDGPQQFKPTAIVPNGKDISGATIFFSTLEGLTAPDGLAGANSPFAQSLADVLDVSSLTEGTHARAFEDVYGSLSMRLSQLENYKPEMRRASFYKLPLIRTRQDFELEKEAWHGLRRQFESDLKNNANLGMEGYASAAARMKCNLETFLPDNGASYFGLEARKAYKKLSGISKSRCKPDKNTPLPTAESLIKRESSYEAIRSPELKKQFIKWSKTISHAPLGASGVVEWGANLRTAPRVADGNIVKTLQAGETVRVDGFEGPTAKWTKVWHPAVGQGFVSTDLISGPVVPMNMTFEFSDKSRSPSDADRARISDVLTRVGAGILFDFSIRYSGSDRTLGLVRALSTASFLNSLLAKTTAGNDVRVLPLLVADTGIASGKVILDLDIVPIAAHIYKLAREQRTAKGTSSINLDKIGSAAKLVANPSIVSLPNLAK